MRVPSTEKWPSHFSTDRRGSVEVGQDILDSAILHAINDGLGAQVLEASVAKALERVRNEQKKFPDQRVAIERELSLIQTRLHHLVEHIANGRATDAIDASLHHERPGRRRYWQNW